MKSLLLGAGSLLLIFTIACGGSSSPSSPTPASPSPGSSSTVSIPNGASFLTTTAFSPDVDDVTVGTTVTWTNNDSTAHTSVSDQPGWDSGSFAPGRSFSFTFSNAGTFTYHCAIHPGMVGTIVVH